MSILVKGTRKVDKRSGRATSRSPRVDLNVNRYPTRIYLDFSTGGMFAIKWSGLAAIMLESILARNLQEAGITVEQYEALLKSIENNGEPVDE